MTASLLDAFDTVVHSTLVLGRLRDAQKLIARKQQLNDEKQWLTLATDRLAAACENIKDLATRSSRLPELESVREDLAKTLQNAAVDAVERLQAGITFQAGPRAPVLEELFGHFKLPAMRRAKREDFEKFIGAFSKKLKSQYVKRMLSDPDFAFALPAVETLNASFETWRGAFSSERLPDAQEAALRKELTTVAGSLEQPLQQARLLAEAALITVDGAFVDSGIGAKPKKRSAPKSAAAAAQPEAEAPVVSEPEAVAAEAEAAAEELAPVEAAAPVVKAKAPKKKPAAKSKSKAAAADASAANG